MYRAARRSSGQSAAPNGAAASANGGAWDPGAGYWPVPAAAGGQLPTYAAVGGVGGAAFAGLGPGMVSLSSAPRPGAQVDLQAKRKIRRARRQERNAAMRYEELLIRLEQLIIDHGGAEFVTTDSIVQMYQVRVAPLRLALPFAPDATP